MKNLPTPEQTIIGNEVSSLLFDCSMAKALGEKPQVSGEHADLIAAYLADEIDAVSAIFAAMVREGSKQCGKVS